MNLLTFNCGSSSLKSKLFALTEGAAALGDTLAAVTVERIGARALVHLSRPDGDTYTTEATVPDHATAVGHVLSSLDALDPGWATQLHGIAHRVVHGGRHFSQPALLDASTIAVLESLQEIAPLHNGPALAAIGAAREALGTLDVSAVAVFDTAFHVTMPERAARYAIPYELSERYALYRYGFHGLAHRYMAEQYCRLSGVAAAGSTLITLQLGSGCSVAAIADGHSIDTSMGFTPLEGLVMATRSGDTDPAIVPFLARHESVSPDEVEHWLNTRSGLLGVSGTSPDVRDLLESESAGDARAALALDMFCYRARKYIGSYMAALGGADAIVFGGGIGEHLPEIRARICDGLQWSGLALDRVRNEATLAVNGRISADSSRISAFVVRVDEEQILAREALDWLAQRGGSGR
jgi:acetate kinase